MASKARSLWPRLLLLGDSLTQQSFSSDGCWGAMLADSFQRRCDVIARGFSGYNSRQWMSICRNLPLESLRGDVAVLWLGANDACTSPLQHVPIDEYRKNLADIVRHLKTSCGVSEVVLLTPPPSNPSGMTEELAMVRSAELTEQYAETCKLAAQDVSVTCVDLHTNFKKQSDWPSLLSDGLHLSQRGAMLVHSLVLPVLVPLIDQFSPQHMGPEDLILPLWRDAANVINCPDINEWIAKHPMPPTNSNEI
ncbi:isoamyl acetate-hydrolyzing esterase 1 homolog [Hyalella azteca]|uniref:Isoamyl acetate-hydrolyzing esterase 1 homolog n=1 Tax=Hyalella azteca TaxID=294128 RepID=A0A8B7P395_HYAAZ|nr:isoamyl acetate-hydrolyzing esterase 1 homolog [Hyalella azteca]